VRFILSVLTIAALALLSSLGRAQSDQEAIQDRAISALAHAEAVFRSAEITLMVVADIIAREINGNQAVIHATIKRYNEKVPGIRAILFVGADGVLQLDSATYPAKPLQLGDRQYVREVPSNGEVRIFETIAGRSSGMHFVPVAKAVVDGNGARLGTLVAVVNPAALLPNWQQCNSCLSVLLLGEKGIVTHPAGGDYSAEATNLIGKTPTGDGIGPFMEFEMAASWRRSEQYPITVMWARRLK